MRAQLDLQKYRSQFRWVAREVRISHPRGHQGGTIPELHTCRAPGKTSLVEASTATGQVKWDGAELALLV